MNRWTIVGIGVWILAITLHLANNQIDELEQRIEQCEQQKGEKE
jgi:hypothetical protein